jgi:hypothetical protein
MVRNQMMIFDQIQASGVFTVWGSPGQLATRVEIEEQVREDLRSEMSHWGLSTTPPQEQKHVSHSPPSRRDGRIQSPTDHGEGKGERFGEAKKPGPPKKKVGRTVKTPPDFKVNPGEGGKAQPSESHCVPCELELKGEPCHLPNHRHKKKLQRGQGKGKPRNYAVWRIKKRETELCRTPTSCQDPHLHCEDPRSCKDKCCKVVQDHKGLGVSAPSLLDATDPRNSRDIQTIDEMLCSLNLVSDDFKSASNGAPTSVETLDEILTQKTVTIHRREQEDMKRRDEEWKRQPHNTPYINLWGDEQERITFGENPSPPPSSDDSSSEEEIENLFRSQFSTDDDLSQEEEVNWHGCLPMRREETRVVLPGAVVEEKGVDGKEEKAQAIEIAIPPSEYWEYDEEEDCWFEEKHNNKPEMEPLCASPEEEVLDTTTSGTRSSHTSSEEATSPLRERVERNIHERAPQIVKDRMLEYVPSSIRPDVLVPAHFNNLPPKGFVPDFTGFYEPDPESVPASKFGSFNPKLEEALIHTYGDVIQPGICGFLKHLCKKIVPYTLATLETTSREGTRLQSTIGMSWTLLSNKVFFLDGGVSRDYYLTLGLTSRATHLIFKKFADQLLATSRSLPAGAKVSEGKVRVNTNYVSALDFYVRKTHPGFFDWIRSQPSTVQLLEAWHWTLCYIAVENAVLNLKATAGLDRNIRTVKALSLGAPPDIVVNQGVIKTYTGEVPTLEYYRDNNLFVKSGTFADEGILDFAAIIKDPKRKLKRPQTYTSSNMGIIHSAVVPSKTIVQMTCALTRLTNSVEPHLPRFHETLMVNGYRAWNDLDLDDYYNFPLYHQALSQVKYDLGELYQEATKHPVKGPEYTHCHDENLANGLLMNPDVEADGRESVNAGKQKIEPMKFKTEARLYVTLGPKNAMVGQKAAKALKGIRSSEPIQIISDDERTCGVIYFIDKTDRESLNEVARLAYEGTRSATQLLGGNPLPDPRNRIGDCRYMIFDHSDDTKILLEEFVERSDGVGYWRKTFYSVDISKCDKSHAGIFDHFWRFWEPRLDLYHLLEAQLCKKMRIQVGNCKMDAWLTPKSPVLLSGHSFTTFINTFASDFLGIHFIQRRARSTIDFVSVAYSVGYKIKCARHEEPWQADFLKHSFGRTIHGAPVAVPFLGNLFRFFGHRIGDVPGRGDLETRWLLYNLGNLKSFTHGIQSPWITTMIVRFETKLGKRNKLAQKLRLRGDPKKRRAEDARALFEAIDLDDADLLFATEKRIKDKEFVATVKAVKADVDSRWYCRRDMSKKIEEPDILEDRAWVQRYITKDITEAMLLDCLRKFVSLEHGEYFRSVVSDHIMMMDYSLDPARDFSLPSHPPPTLYMIPDETGDTAAATAVEKT